VHRTPDEDRQHSEVVAAGDTAATMAGDHLGQLARGTPGGNALTRWQQSEYLASYQAGRPGGRGDAGRARWILARMLAALLPQSA
jgi:hypothetical protein